MLRGGGPRALAAAALRAYLEVPGRNAQGYGNQLGERDYVALALSRLRGPQSGLMG